MKIKELISRGETEKAIEVLLELARSRSDNDLENQVINLSSQFHGLEQKKRSLTITSSQASAKLSQINVLLLEIADEVGENNSVSEEVASGNAGVNNVQVSSHTEESIKDLKQEDTLDRLGLLMRKRKFFQNQFDIAVDASQKFNLQENINEMDAEIAALKESL